MAEDIKVKITADTKELNTEIKKSVNIVKRAVDKMRASFKRLSVSFKKIAKVTAVAGAGLAYFGKRVINQGDRLQKLGLRLKVSTEFLSEYSYIAELAGTNIESVGRSLQFMQKSIGEATLGTGEAVVALKELNLEANQLTKLDTASQFEAIRNAISKVENQSKKLFLAQRLLGRGGTELLQIFNQSTEAINKQKTEVQKFGAVITQETANAMAQFNDDLTKLKTLLAGAFINAFKDNREQILAFTKSLSNEKTKNAVRGLVDLITDSVAILTKIILKFGETYTAFKEIIRDIGRVSNEASKNVRKTLDNLSLLQEAERRAKKTRGSSGKLIDIIGSPILALRKDENKEIDVITKKAKVYLKIQKDVNKEFRIMELWRRKAKGGRFGETDETLLSQMGTASQALSNFKKNQEKKIQEAFKVLQNQTEKQRKKIFLEPTMRIKIEKGTLQEALKKAIPETLETLKTQAEEVFTTINEIAVNSTDSWADNLVDSIMEGKNALEGMRSLAKSVFNDIARGLLKTHVTQPLTKGISNLISFGLDAFTGGQKLTGKISSGIHSIEGFPARAEGGLVSRGQAYTVGERGAELFIPNISGRVSSRMGMVNNRTVVVNNNFSVGVEDTVQARILEAVPTLTSATKNAVFEEIERGGEASRRVGRN